MRRKQVVIIGSLVSLFCLAIYLLRLDNVAGQVNDDGWYLVLAQALAEQQSYSLVSSPLPGITPLYPPAFPALLSLVFLVAPEFPGNLWLLKLVSIAAMIATGWVTYVYLARQREVSSPIALGMAVIVVLSPSFVFLATSTVMSECVFTLGQLLVIFLIERGVQQSREKKTWHLFVLAGTITAFAFLTRSVAVALIAATGLYLLKEKLWRPLLIYTCVVVALTGSWTLYTRARTPTLEQSQQHGGMIVYGYGHHFWLRRAGDTMSGQITVRDLPRRILENSNDIVTRSFVGLLTPSFLRDAKESGQEVLGLGYNSAMKEPSMGLAGETKIISLVLCLIALTGYVVTIRSRITLAEIMLPLSLFITVIWPWWPFRFLLPLTPFLIFYLLTGLAFFYGQGARLIRREAFATVSPAPLWRVFVLCLIVLFCADHAQYIQLKTRSSATSQIPWSREFEDVSATLKWIRETLPQDAVIASSNPGQIWMYTGRKTLALSDPATNWESWKKLQVRYVVILSANASSPLDTRNDLCQVVWKSSRRDLRILDLGDPATRPAWAAAQAKLNR